MKQGIVKTSGFLLIIAAATFWFSWFLMPDQGTADALHILEIVKQNRTNVFSSVIVQVISSVLYIPALFLLFYSLPTIRKTSLWGMIFLTIGAMGTCMDAFFHLLAYFMTDPRIHMESDIVNLMVLMQTKGIVLLIPLLLSFFIGSIMLGFGLREDQYISNGPRFIFIGTLIFAVIGAVMANAVFHQGRGLVVLSVLGLFAAGQTWMGLDLMKRKGVQ